MKLFFPSGLGVAISMVISLIVGANVALFLLSPKPATQCESVMLNAGEKVATRHHEGGLNGPPGVIASQV